jgi:endonuclease/exonuclease/phosphatase family metal-dependent hydrolase
LRVANPQHGQFTNIIVVPGTGLQVPRGWCSVDVTVRGRTFRCINAHLEEETQPGLQWLQTQELLGGPADVNYPVMLAGDLNTDANHQNGTFAYDTLLAAGFGDPWSVLHPADPGLTWGHDAYLANPQLALVWRIDLVLVRGGVFVPLQMAVLDGRLPRGTPPLWPSDHAGVFASFLLQ